MVTSPPSAAHRRISTLSAYSQNRAFRRLWRWFGRCRDRGALYHAHAAGLTIDLTNAAFGSGQLRIGAETVDVTTLSASPNIVPAVAAADPTSGLPLFSPRFSVGAGAISESTATPVSSFNAFADFVTQLNTTFATPTSATQLVARGMYNRDQQHFYRFQYRRSALNYSP